MVVALAAAVLMASAPATAGDGTRFPSYTGDEFNELFTTAPLEGLAPPGPAPHITGSADTDERIRAIAERRGYVRRPLATSLVWVDGHRLQPAAAAAWEELQAEAARAGHPLRLLAGYRSVASQRSIFLHGLDGSSDAAIDKTLRRAAPPGYSKHHTGYAVDISQSGWSAVSFDHSPGGRWLAADDYRNAKRFGFIPSYPPDASRQGPEPEPWEWTYVGVDVARCGAFHLGYPSGEAAANPTGTVYDLETCGDLVISRGAVAYYLAATMGLEGGGDAFSDDDGTVYEEAVDAIAAAGLTSGCDPPARDRFCPRESITRGEMAALLNRALDLPPAGGDLFSDDAGSPLEEAIERAAAAGVITSCNPPAGDRFCPDEPVVRFDLLAFLARGFTLPPRPGDHEGAFMDDDGSVFEADIEWLARTGITRGCNPPLEDRFCPDGAVTRGEMAAFLARALELEDGPAGTFTDTGGSVHAGEIAALAEAGITAGCNPPEGDRFCPGEVVTRAQIAAFLVRALELGASGGAFSDTHGHLFETEISALAEAGVTRGCNPPVGDRFCPDESVTRAQLAALLRRGFDAGS